LFSKFDFSLKFYIRRVSGAKWIFSARAAVMTMLASFGGGLWSLMFSLNKNNGRVDLLDLINGTLAALVSITAGCFLYRAWEAMFVGLIGAVISCFCTPIFDMMGVDDPVGAAAVHGLAGIWGVVAVGLFADDPTPLGTTNGRSGLFKGGGWYLLGIQSLASLCLLTWGVISTFAILWIINKFIAIRMDPIEELIGADLMEHRINHGSVSFCKNFLLFILINISI
jgi:ammonia channel protein AmtB